MRLLEKKSTLRYTQSVNTLFSILHRDAGSKARCGTLLLPHGTVSTPAFMPVGTRAAVKGMTADDLREIGFDIILANTYHLFLRPQVDVIRKAGGLHGFTKWQKNFLTDSGGFQVFSLSRLRKLSENGVRFQSHIDGRTFELTPEKVVELQVGFNSDIQMQLDICSQYGIDKKQADKELNFTINWLRRGYRTWKAFHDGTQENTEALCCGASRYEGRFFPIIQGGFYKDLRRKSLDAILELGTEGLAIGGISIGETPDEYAEILTYTAGQIPEDKAKYVMGIGTPEYILEAVKNGIDIFDCVLPTRNARNGSLFTAEGPIAIKKAVYKFDYAPIDPQCSCKVCRRYSRAYLHHLFQEHEILYISLATYHNLFFLHHLVQRIRESINGDRFTEFAQNFLAKYRERS